MDKSAEERKKIFYDVWRRNGREREQVELYNGVKQEEKMQLLSVEATHARVAPRPIDRHSGSYFALLIQNGTPQ